MKWRYLLFTIAVLAGVLLRLPQLDLRPMHVDEAVHAIKFGDLLERHTYRYDPAEYHGPTLNYFTLIPAWLTSETTLTQVHELTLRIVPVFFGILLIFLPVLIDRTIPPIVLVAALLTAVSPAMVFYSRYYIQETLLVCFTFGAIVSGLRYIRGRNPGWAAALGMFLGLMHATKETSIIALGAMVGAAALVLLCRPREERKWPSISLAHVAVTIVCAALASVLFYSSFFTNWQGVADSLTTYSTYFGRAGNKTLHQHPWYYYLSTLFFSHTPGGPVWSEAVILDLAAVGAAFVILRRNFTGGLERDSARFFVLYSVFMIVIYSAIPYKTPWSMLGLLHGCIIVGAIGFDKLWSIASSRIVRGVLVTILFLGVSHLAWQAAMANFRYYANPVNPYVYAQAVDDVVTVGDLVKSVADSTPEKEGMPIQIVCTGDDYWPLPWYLRSFSHAGWWNGIQRDFVPTPIILASPDLESRLMQRLYEAPPPGERSLYVPLFSTRMDLRPGVEIRGYVRHDVWENYLRERTGNAVPVK